MSDQSPPSSIFDLGTALAKAAAAEEAAKGTSVEFSANQGAGQAPRVGVQVAHTSKGERWAFSLAAWFEQKFEPGGRSAGLKGKVTFD